MRKNIFMILILTASIIIAAMLPLSQSTQAAQYNNFIENNSQNKLNINFNNDGPDSYTLNQNYPNPFNPTTTITYAIPDESFVTLKVYNSVGNEVATLMNKTQDAGYHKIIFNGDELSSGVYYAQLKAGSYLKVIKMILLK